MQMVHRLILAAALMAGLAPVMASPTPVPALPDTERRTTYSITNSTCACAVNFAIYGDSTDYGDWIEVWLNGVLQSTGAYTVTSPTGPLATIPRPITDAIVTFNAAQTGTVQIVGARRPRRVSQFSENTGVSARNLNQVITDIVAMLREMWDKINDVSGRVVMAPPGETLTMLPPAASRANFGACFDANGNVTTCVSVPSSTFAAGTAITFTGTNPTTISANAIASTSAVTGASTTYIASQSAKLVLRSNSGSPMSDILPGTSPGVLPAKTVINVKNADSAGVLSIKAGAGATIEGPLPSTGYLYVCPGQTVSFFSDGSNYWPIGSIRCKLQAATTIYVATTGSASNDGLTASTPVADPSFAYTLLQNNFDLNGNVATISLATGTYPQVTLTGPIIGNVVTRNSNNVLLLGNAGTPSNVKIADTGSTGFAAIQVLGGAAVTLNGFQVTSVNNSDLIADLNANVFYQNIDWHGVHSGLNHVISITGGRITLAGNETISSSAGCHWISGNGGNIESTGTLTPVVTLTGTPAWSSGYVCTQYSGSNIVIQNGITFSGAATGPRVNVLGLGYINSGALGGCANFPGSTAGTISSVGVCQ